MKGLAIALLPGDKVEKDSISYAELESEGHDKDKITITSTKTLELITTGVEEIRRLIGEFSRRTSETIPMVFGAHVDFNFTTENLINASGNLTAGLPNLSIENRTYYPEINPRIIDEPTIAKMNEVFGIEIDIFGEWSDDFDFTLDAIAQKFSRPQLQERDRRFIGIQPNDNYIITRIIKAGGKLRERFGIHFCRYLGTEHNVCMKPIGWNKNAAFSDVTATHIADLIDKKTGEPPRIVHAIIR